MQFSEIPGAESLAQTLTQAVARDHVAHAQMFLGAAGGTGLATAWAYAQYLLCQNRGEREACGKCSSCRMTQKLNHPDLHFVYPTSTTKKVSKREAALSEAFLPEWREFLIQNPYRQVSEWAAKLEVQNKQMTIPVAESRQLIKKISVKSYMGSYKILILWAPEHMHPGAANSLLKALEEPPAKTIFLLVANDPGRIIGTILSRCQILRVLPLQSEEVRNFLAQKGATPERATELALIAGSNLALALERLGGQEDEYRPFFQQWMRLCFRPGYGELLKMGDNFSKMDKSHQQELLAYCIQIFRETAIHSHAGEELLQSDEPTRQFLANFSKIVSWEKVMELSPQLETARYHLERNANAKMLFTTLSIRMGRILRRKG